MAFADRGFEFFLDLGLRLAQHVLDDPFSALRVIACGVAAFPSAILAFSDVALAVCSSLWHGISPFRNEQYRNQGNKATRKSNCYQKVIIFAGCLIFDYCGAIFALLGMFSLVTAVRFLNGQEALSIVYSGAKYARSVPKIDLAWNHFFEQLKTAVLLIDCETATLKSPLSRGPDAPHVHLRLRKRLSRCTLDCGFKTSESPALRGFEAERGPITGTSLYLC